jgi:hypothetical protein
MKVSKKAKALLRRAIDEKWKPIRAGEGVDNGTGNCSLCQEYYEQKYECSGCPISKKTKRTDCLDTPYWAWENHQRKKHHSSYPQTVKCFSCKRFATRFINWLEALYSELTR